MFFLFEFLGVFCGFKVVVRSGGLWMEILATRKAVQISMKTLVFSQISHFQLTEKSQIESQNSHFGSSRACLPLVVNV